MVVPYRLGFAVKVLGNGGLKTADGRRWQTGPHLSRSIELLDAVFDYLDEIDVRVYRMSSSTVPYGTHPDLPELDYRIQISSCEAELDRLGKKALELGLRLSTHPGQYTVLNSPDEEIARKARLDVEQDAMLLDKLGAGPEAVVVLHVGGVYGDREASLERWARGFELLSERAQRRLVVEHDERCFALDDVLMLHERTGVRVVFDLHHFRCNPGGQGDTGAALTAALNTWPGEIRPKVHVSSPRTELREVGKTLRAPLLDQHADFLSPWDLLALLEAADRPVDVMVEAKAKDLAALWVRAALARVAPEAAAAETTASSETAARGRHRTVRASRSPGRTHARS
jgi:UV DNA damage endonuclease